MDLIECTLDAVIHVTGWDELGFVPSDAVVYVHPSRTVNWTDDSGVSRELGTLTPAQYMAIREA